MSISNALRRITFAGGTYLGVSDFPIGFAFSLNSHIRAVKISATGVQTALSYGVNYSLSGAGSAAGGVFSLIGFTLVAGETLVIERLVPPLQLIDLTNNSDIFPVVFEAGLDYAAQFQSQVEDVIGLYDATKARVPKLVANETDGASAYDFRNNRGKNCANPTSAQDVATRSYVDAAVAAVAGGGGGGGGGGSTALLQFNNAPPAADAIWKNKMVVVRYTGGLGPSVVMICLEFADGIYDWVAIGGSTV